MRHFIVLAAGLWAAPAWASDTVDVKTAEQIMSCTAKVGEVINKRYGDPHWIRVSSGDGKALYVDAKTQKRYESVECDPKGVFVMKSWSKVD